MVSFTDDEFDQIVEWAIDQIPERFLSELDNVIFAVEDEPSQEEIDAGYGDMLGVYDGIPLTQRAGSYGAVDDYPDCITIFKGPHERLEGTRDEIIEEVRKTVVHEVGHYFGMTEEQIDAMGYH